MILYILHIKKKKKFTKNLTLAALWRMACRGREWKRAEHFGGFWRSRLKDRRLIDCLSKASTEANATM